VAVLTVEETRTFQGVADLEVACRVVESSALGSLDCSPVELTSAVQSPASAAGGTEGSLAR